jgi:hypothetical protein
MEHWIVLGIVAVAVIFLGLQFYRKFTNGCSAQEESQCGGPDCNARCDRCDIPEEKRR